jgi:hypothetical protein
MNFMKLSNLKEREKEKLKEALRAERRNSALLFRSRSVNDPHISNFHKPCPSTHLHSLALSARAGVRAVQALLDEHSLGSRRKYT